MSDRQGLASRSPLHPKALRAADLTVGRRIIRFNFRSGISDEATVMAPPFEDYLGPVSESNEGRQKQLVVTLKSKDGSVHNAALTDMGVASNADSSWSPRNFTIGVNHRHLLPDADPTIEPLRLERLLLGDVPGF